LASRIAICNPIEEKSCAESSCLPILDAIPDSPPAGPDGLGRLISGTPLAAKTAQGEATMRDEPADAAVRSRRLQELLLGYLQAVHAPPWPGVDGLTVREVLRGYAEHAASGRVPDLQELLHRHPDLRDALLAFFTDRSRRQP
jgi:hypothetical protein